MNDGGGNFNRHAAAAFTDGSGERIEATDDGELLRRTAAYRGDQNVAGAHVLPTATNPGEGIGNHVVGGDEPGKRNRGRFPSHSIERRVPVIGCIATFLIVLVGTEVTGVDPAVTATRWARHVDAVALTDDTVT